MKCEKHEWETLDDGSRICFECNEQEESQAPLKKIGRQPWRDYDRNKGRKTAEGAAIGALGGAVLGNRQDKQEQPISRYYQP